MSSADLSKSDGSFTVSDIMGQNSGSDSLDVASPNSSLVHSFKEALEREENDDNSDSAQDKSGHESSSDVFGGGCTGTKSAV